MKGRNCVTNLHPRCNKSHLSLRNLWGHWLSRELTKSSSFPRYFMLFTWCEYWCTSDTNIKFDCTDKTRCYLILRSHHIARRHGHVFRMALHNEQDWRMETWQRARQGELSCLHTPIPELWNAILNTCQMPSRFYIIPSNVNKRQTHLLKLFIAHDLMEGHICRQNTLMFALVFCLNCVYAPPARAVTAITQVKNPIHDGKRGQLKLPKSHERYHNVVIWHWIVYKWRRSKQMLSFHRTFFNLLDFTVSLSCRDCHSETPWSHSSNKPGSTYCQSRDFWLRTNYTLEMWCANAKLANQVSTNPVKTLVIPMSWSDRCFEWQER